MDTERDEMRRLSKTKAPPRGGEGQGEGGKTTITRSMIVPKKEDINAPAWFRPREEQFRVQDPRIRPWGGKDVLGELA